MKKNYLFKLLLSVALLIGGCGCVMAQDGKAKAEELFRFLMDGKGDSVHVRLTEEIRSKIAPAVLVKHLNSWRRNLDRFNRKVLGELPRTVT